MFELDRVISELEDYEGDFKDDYCNRSIARWMCDHGYESVDDVDPDDFRDLLESWDCRACWACTHFVRSEHDAGLGVCTMHEPRDPEDAEGWADAIRRGQEPTGDCRSWEFDDTFDEF